ncbi:hypothetical protein FB381_4109 [Nocardioides albertanoniae]|uniref:Uncharacterized protein n=1 Tax=Nocardioides albertanoniae TaxID=1175486 RepID=A0A543ACC5_9ACTN|nr:hypothetical protein [Nocardioides albertanoniae]TQL70180.1 hypothetical protein FB381_4109 [Nocardioides albertanoniae]
MPAATGGAYGTAYGLPPHHQPKKKNLGLLIGLGAAGAVVLVALLGTGAWAFFTGRLGFGPLSAEDQKAVTAIAADAPKPGWASAGDSTCAAEELVRDERTDGLTKAGLIKTSGESVAYTGDWKGQQATTYAAGLLSCSGDWSKAIGKEWALDDTGCLGDVDEAAMAGLITTRDMKVADAKADKQASKAVKELDECYVSDELSAPSATATPAVLGVDFAVKAPSVDGSEVALRARSADSSEWKPVTDGKINIPVREGGQEGCATFEASISYPWGTTKASESESCGKAKERRLWWTKDKSCAQPKFAPCSSWTLHYEGYQLFSSVKVNLKLKGGNCRSASGSCSDTAVVTRPSGTWTSWTAPKGWHDRFTAEVDGLTAVLPN